MTFKLMTIYQYEVEFNYQTPLQLETGEYI